MFYTGTSETSPHGVLSIASAVLEQVSNGRIAGPNQRGRVCVCASWAPAPRPRVQRPNSYHTAFPEGFWEVYTGVLGNSRPHMATRPDGLPVFSKRPSAY